MPKVDAETGRSRCLILPQRWPSVRVMSESRACRSGREVLTSNTLPDGLAGWNLVAAGLKSLVIGLIEVEKSGV